MRPKYETQKDLDNEQRVVEMLALHGYRVEKLPMQYRLDFAIFKGDECVAFGEMKRRYVESWKYPTVMISLSKVLAGRWLTQVTNKPSYLILLYNDKLMRLDLSCDFDLRMGGRSDRGDAQDRDICAYFPVESLSEISKV